MSRSVQTKIEQGFPETKAALEQEVQPYWRVKDMLSAYKGIIYMGDRVVVPYVMVVSASEVLL